MLRSPNEKSYPQLLIHLLYHNVLVLSSWGTVLETSTNFSARSQKLITVKILRIKVQVQAHKPVNLF